MKIMIWVQVSSPNPEPVFCIKEWAEKRKARNMIVVCVSEQDVGVSRFVAVQTIAEGTQARSRIENQ